MRLPILSLFIAATTLPAFGQPAQEEGELLCPVEDLTGLTMLPPLNPPIAGAEVRKALMVCVAFPNLNAPELPTWLPPMAGEGVEGYFEEFIRKVSDEKQILNITFERQPAPNQELSFMAQNDDTWYQNYYDPQHPSQQGHGILNEEILNRVMANHLVQPAYLAQFDLIIMVYNGDPYPVLEDWGGIADLDLPPSFPFEKRGYSVRLHTPGQSMNSDLNRVHNSWVQIHEYGHLQNLDHSPRSDFEDPCRKKRGRYDPMQANVPHTQEYGYYSYHVLHLLQLGWIAPERVVGPRLQGQLNILDDVRNDGNILKIPIATWDSGCEEYYLVLNHQGSDYDAFYPGTGLAIWHIRQSGSVDPADAVNYWDLEVATGMFDPEGLPDAIAGTDSLDGDGRALATDLWSSGEFGPATNPNTNLYQPLRCPVQKASSGVSLTGITEEAGAAMSFFVTMSAPEPAFTVALDVPPTAFLGLDCEATQMWSLPLNATVLDADGTPLEGIPTSWMLLSLTPVPIPGGTLAFCSGGGTLSVPATDSSGSTGATLYHACGGGEYEVAFELLGSVFQTSQAKLRTPDLDADGGVDMIDLAIWANPSGPVEDDIRDLDFDLDFDQLDANRIGDNMGSELEPNINITALAPSSGAELAVGTSQLLASALCVSGGESLDVSYRGYIGSQYTLLASGLDLSSFQWLVSPPLGACELRYVAESLGLGSSFASVPVRVVAPAVAITPSFSPYSLSIGATGTVTVRLKDNESVPVSDITAELVFVSPPGALEILSGPTPAGPYDFNAGQFRDIVWSVRRLSGTGGVQARLDLRLDGFTEVIKSKTFTVFGPSGG
jgi:hypothetical protein